MKIWTETKASYSQAACFSIETLRVFYHRASTNTTNVIRLYTLPLINPQEVTIFR